MKHLFFDTNVLIDFLADRKPFSNAAAKLFDYAEKGKLCIYISAVSYNNIYYILRQYSSNKETLKLLSMLAEMTEIIDVKKSVIRESLNSDFKDFEDAIQYHSALTNKKIDAIVTRDTKDFKTSVISVLTPTEAMSMMEDLN